MGYGWTMEGWDPRLVHALARHNRVVMFDNAGIGHTQPLPGELTATLTIDAMADQTSALIDTLGLGRPDVLGWSMGGMIAQALAVLHPAQVRRLVLCATFPGTGAVSDWWDGTDAAGGREARCDRQRPYSGAVEERHPAQVQDKPLGLVIDDTRRVFQEPGNLEKV